MEGVFAITGMPARETLIALAAVFGLLRSPTELYQSGPAIPRFSGEARTMSRLRLIKWAVITSWVIAAILLAARGSLSKTDSPRADSARNGTVANQDDYVGSEACSACHDAEFNS